MRGRSMVVLVACAGCSGDQLAAAPDASSDNDPRALVTVQLFADAVDLAGFPVYFQDADSSLVMATRTDRDGRARARMQPGGFATVVLRNGRMFTYADVRGGDTLIVNAADNNTDRRELQVVVPPSPGANVYTMWTSCGASGLDRDPIAQGLPQRVLLVGCDATSDVVITAYSTEPQPIGSNYRYLFRKEVALDASAVTTFEGAFEPQIDTEVIATALHEPAEHVKFTQQLVRDRKDLGGTRTVTVDVVGNSASGRIAKTFAPAEGTTLTRVEPLPLGVSNQVTLVWGPSDRETEIALGERALRSYTTRPQLAIESNRVQWTEEPEGLLGDLVLLELAWQRPQTQSRSWKLLAPRTDAASVRYPVLPVPELQPPADAWILQLATIAVDSGSSARTTLLGGWPGNGNDAWLADTDAGRADYRVLAGPVKN